MLHHSLLIFAALELFTFVLTGCVLYLMPLWSRRTIFFSVTVLPEFRDSPEGRRILRRYKIEVLIHSLIGVSLLLAGIRFYPIWGFMAGLLWQIAGCFHAHNLARKLVLPHSARPSTLRGASLETGKARIPGGWLLQAGPFVILIASNLYLRAHWAHIPSKYPIHWNLHGVPNGWQDKKTALGMEGLFAGAATLAGLLFFTYFIAHHGRRVHATGAAGALEQQHHRANLQCITISSYLLAAIFSLVSLQALHPAFDAAVLTSVTVILLVLIALSIMIWTRMSNLSPERELWIDEKGAPIGDRTEDRYWKWGCYANPNDPALIVEKRMGIGYTINMAHPKAWLLLGAMIGVFLIWPLMTVFHHQP